MTENSSSGSNDGNDDLSQEEAIKKRLETHRDTLERLVTLGVPASEDARRALELLDSGKEGGQS
jgi:hypothetical protein